MSSLRIHSMTVNASSRTDRSTPLRAESAWRRNCTRGHAGDLLGVLERQENARLATSLRRPIGDVLALVEDLALGHLVARRTEQRLRQRRLAAAVRPHQGVQFASRDHQVDAAEDFGALDRNVQVADLEQGRFGLGRGHDGRRRASRTMVFDRTRISTTAVGEICRVRVSTTLAKRAR